MDFQFNQDHGPCPTCGRCRCCGNQGFCFSYGFNQDPPTTISGESPDEEVIADDYITKIMQVIAAVRCDSSYPVTEEQIREILDA